jgi:hypothetical protein
VSPEVAATTPPSRPPRSWNGEGEVLGVVPLLRAEDGKNEPKVCLVATEDGCPTERVCVMNGSLSCKVLLECVTAIVVPTVDFEGGGRGGEEFNQRSEEVISTTLFTPFSAFALLSDSSFS